MMQNPAVPQAKTNSPPYLFNQTQCWDNIRVEQFHNPAGEGDCHFEAEHTLFMSLAPRPIHYLQAQDGKVHTGLYRKGDLSIAPANTPFFARWEGEEHYLRIRLTIQFVQSVARETFEQVADRLALLPEFQFRK
ncbi:MAG: hypothetical protein MJA27_02800 [Pseudanabaenales cyanobacterium]|nr:hypothetical protein [Pseudanabaenales cyanobacterium]